MKTVYGLFLITLLVTLCQPILGQSEKSAKSEKKATGCRVHVQIINYNWETPSSSTPDRLSANQLDWWLKEGQKNYPDVCLTTNQEDSDYIIAWTETSEDRTYTYTVPKTETTRHNGTINTTSNSTSTSTNGLGVVNTSGTTSGTYNGTSTKTTYEEKKGERSIWYINAYVHKVSEVNGQKKPEKIPVFMAKNKGQFVWSKPDKDAFAKAIKYVSEQSK